MSSPEPWAGQTLSAQILGEVQIRNTKELFWEIVSIDPHGTPIIQRRKAGNKALGVDQHGTLCGKTEKIKTHRDFVRGLTKKDQTFTSATFHRFLP